MIADVAVVPDMGIRHDHVLAADACDAALAGRSMDRGAFAQRRIVADDDMGRFVLIFEILGRAADDRSAENLASASQNRILLDDDMRVKDRSGPDSDIPTDHTVGTDLNIGFNFGGRIEDRRWMYARLRHDCCLPRR